MDQAMYPERYADQLLEGIANAIDLEIWEVARSLAKTLAAHIEQTGEYPTDLPKEQMEHLLVLYEQNPNRAFGPG